MDHSDVGDMFTYLANRSSLKKNVCLLNNLDWSLLKWGMCLRT